MTALAAATNVIRSREPPPALPWRVVALVLLPFAGGFYLSYLYRSVNALIADHLANELGIGAAPTRQARRGLSHDGAGRGNEDHSIARSRHPRCRVRSNDMLRMIDRRIWIVLERADDARDDELERHDRTGDREPRRVAGAVERDRDEDEIDAHGEEGVEEPLDHPPTSPARSGRAGRTGSVLRACRAETHARTGVRKRRSSTTGSIGFGADSQGGEPFSEPLTPDVRFGLTGCFRVV